MLCAKGSPYYGVGPSLLQAASAQGLGTEWHGCAQSRIMDVRPP